MSNHALSLAQAGLDVILCGYDESPVSAEVAENPHITIKPIEQIRNTTGMPFALFAVRKVALQHVVLFRLLKQYRHQVEYLFVQNPPSIPVLGVSRFFVLFMSQRTRLVVDWHNLGYSILALKLGRRHPFVWAYRIYEALFGRIAYVHLTVTVAMARRLQREFKMNAARIIPLYDRPAHQFKPLSQGDRAKVIDAHRDTLFDGVDTATHRIVVTSTSYTPDENLYTLLDALEQYAAAAAHDATAQGKKLPLLRVIITGKGPMYDEMQREIAHRKLEPMVTVRSAWLASEEYPQVLGTADLGVSLHESSSGVDLPMKIVDLFGCGVPVVAVGFAALPELVKQNDNGIIVRDSSEMAAAFQKVFSNQALLSNLKRGAMRETHSRWEPLWHEKLGRLFGDLPPEEEGADDDSDGHHSD
ncbi:chitobiosyldiphosphodolichol beta-mannosyltransferase [Trichomonascus vanleenenianus]|uniref:chitobiosyldiphosphodolichol beta-1,4 mannosyltransferase n=1 Tax=Trichomonascus vanleenenianus TaxID=2268995 RepID=UPI003ECB5C2B